MSNRVVRKHSGSLISTSDQPIRYDFYAPTSETGNLPVVLFLHGFKGFKDWGTFPDAFFEFARQNFAVVAINFSNGGYLPDSDRIESTELFHNQTITQELDDVRTVLDAIKSGVIGKSAGLSHLYPVGIIGHSRGAHTAILAAAEFEEISCLVAWASVADLLDFWPESMVNDWTTTGETVITNGRTNQQLTIGKQLYEDVLSNRDRYSALKRAAELYIPCLFIHASDDETVPHKNSQKLLQAVPGSDKERLVIDSGGHTFGSYHPYDEDELPPKFAEVVDQTIRWFQTYLF
jgi:uncharacterized protein